MQSFQDLFRDETSLPISLYGTIAVTVANFNILVPVIIPDFDEHLQWGPCRWQSRDATSLPQKGDPCIVMIDSRRDPWVVAWWPF